jgi:hypothetical protein
MKACKRRGVIRAHSSPQIIFAVTFTVGQGSIPETQPRDPLNKRMVTPQIDARYNRNQLGKLQSYTYHKNCLKLTEHCCTDIIGIQGLFYWLTDWTTEVRFLNGKVIFVFGTEF